MYIYIYKGLPDRNTEPKQNVLGQYNKEQTEFQPNQISKQSMNIPQP